MKKKSNQNTKNIDQRTILIKLSVSQFSDFKIILFKKWK